MVVTSSLSAKFFLDHFVHDVSMYPGSIYDEFSLAIISVGIDGPYLDNKTCLTVVLAIKITNTIHWVRN